MDRISLYKSSCVADSNCVVGCKSMANVLLLPNNKNCDAILVKVTYNGGKIRFVWIDNNDKKSEDSSFIPVFAYSEDGEDIEFIEDVEEICVHEIFCHNGAVYYLSENNKSDLVIRSIKTLSSQNIVEQVVKYDEEQKNVQEVYMVNLYTLLQGSGRKYLTTCWVVVYVNNMIEYLPIFAEDVKFFDTYDISDLLRDELSVDETFYAHGKSYQLKKDNGGKLYLSEGKQSKLKLVNFPKKHRATIIRMQKKNGN